MSTPRILLLVLVGALVIAACSAGGDADAPSGTSTTVAGNGIAVPPELADHEIEEVRVGDRLLTLAIADDPSLRAQGLMGVTDLRDLDGMLFFWRHDGDDFWMKDTVIPLDIVWFNEDGTYKDRASMEPCPEEPCREYAPAGGYDFRYAIEANPGDLDWVDEDTVITYVDD